MSTVTIHSDSNLVLDGKNSVHTLDGTHESIRNDRHSNEVTTSYDHNNNPTFAADKSHGEITYGSESSILQKHLCLKNIIFEIKNKTKVFMMVAFCSLVNGCYYPSLKVDVTGLKKGQISEIISEDWMNSTDYVTKKIRRSFVNYLDGNKCVDLKCFEGFGFNECHIESKIKCHYEGVIIITNDERAKTEKNEKINITISVVLNSNNNDFSVSFVRTGSKFVFQ